MRLVYLGPDGTNFNSMHLTMSVSLQKYLVTLQTVKKQCSMKRFELRMLAQGKKKYSETTAITEQMTMRMLSCLSEGDSGRHNGLTNTEQNTLN